MLHDHTLSFAWLIFASLVAGILNAIAGGGSFLSFPALLGMGVLPIEANATNSVAIWPGQFTSIVGYLADLRVNLKLIVPVCSAALTGGLGGAILLLHTGQKTFLAMVPWLLLFATLLFAASGSISRVLERRFSRSARVPAASIAGASGVSPFREETIGSPSPDPLEGGPLDSGPSSPRLSDEVPSDQSPKPALVPLWLGVAVVSLYIGFFGAGAGFLLMSVLAIFGIEHIHQVNALKAIATTTANGIAVVAFIAGHQVDWSYCLPMMVTAAIGGFAGARFSRRLNPRFMRGLVIVVGAGMACYFFWKQ